MRGNVIVSAKALLGPAVNGERTDFRFEAAVELKAFAAIGGAGAGGCRDDGKIEGPGDDAAAGIPDRAIALCVSFACQPIGEARANCCRAGEFVLVVEAFDAVAVSRQSAFHRKIPKPRAQELGRSVKRQRLDDFPSGGVAGDDLGNPPARNRWNVLDLIGPCCNFLRVGLYAVDENINGRGYGGRTRKRWQRCGDEVGAHGEGALRLSAAKTIGPRPSRAAGDAVAGAVGHHVVVVGECVGGLKPERVGFVRQRRAEDRAVAKDANGREETAFKSHVDALK